MTTNETAPAALPATDDIAALVEMHPELARDGDCASYSANGRKLSVYWDTAGESYDKDWSWQTREDIEDATYYESGPLDSASELANLVMWVTGS